MPISLCTEVSAGKGPQACAFKGMARRLVWMELTVGPGGDVDEIWWEPPHVGPVGHGLD